MSARQSGIAWGLVIGGIGFACLALSASQRPPADADTPAAETLLPARSLLYIGWDGTEAHQQVWEKTAAYEAFHTSGLSEAVGQFVQAIGRQTDEKQAKSLLQAYQLISGKGLSLSISLPGDDNPPIPWATLVLHEAAVLEPGLAGLIQKATEGKADFQTDTVEGRDVTSGVLPDTPGIQVGWWTEGRHLVVVAGLDPVRPTLAVADGEIPNVTADPLWKKHRMAPADFDVSSLGWLDFAMLRETYGEIWSAGVPGRPAAEKPLTAQQILEALGLDTLGALVWRSGYQGRASVSRTFLEAPAPRKGLLTFADQNSMTLDDLPPLPSATSNFYASRFDWSKFYDDAVALARDLARLGPPEAEAQVEAMLGQLPVIAGFDPETELFGPLGDVVCVYGDARHGLFGFGPGLAFKVDDAQTLRNTIGRLLMRLAGDDGDLQIADQVRLRTTEKHGREILTLQIAGGMFNPSLVVDEQWLLVGVSPQMVEAFLLRLDGRLAPWEPGPEHREGLEALPREFTSITVSDPREGLQSMLAMLPILAPGIQQAMRQADRQPDREREPFAFSAADLPPTELVTGPLFPNISVSTLDETGIHWQSRTSLPSIPALGTGGTGGIAIGVALLLPAVQQARTAARRTQSRNNLKQIALALHNYHDVHNSFPQGTHPHEDLEPEKRLSWMAPLLPYLDQAPLHRQIDFEKGWDDEANQQWMKTVLPVFQNPGTPERRDADDYGTTHYVGIAGVGKDAPTLPVTDEKAGAFAYNRVTRMADILDGLSNTMGVTEASDDFGPWGAGGRPTLRALTQRPYINGPDGIGGPFPGGLNVMMMDGSVRFVSENVDPQIFEALSTIRGGEVIPQDGF